MFSVSREAFAGTPLASQHSTLQSLSEHAAEIEWQGSWAGTVSQLPHEKGPAMLPAAAALILADQHEAGRKLLLSDASLAGPEHEKIRSQLLEQDAAVIAFDRASDLSFFHHIDW